MKKASLQDIARSLNVSKSLVSFVINGRGDEKGIKPETQRRVLARARELNYKPNHIARGLRLGKSNTLGLIVADISNKFYAKIARRVEEVASSRGYNVIFCSSDEDEKKEIRLIEMLRERQVDGLLISTTQKESSFFTRLKKEQFPFVLFDRQLPRLKTNYVGVNNFEATRDVIEKMIASGYHHIGFLKITPSHLSSVREREAGYRQGLRKQGVRFNSELVHEIDYKNIDQETGNALKNWLERGQSLDAIFTVNNSIAVACLESLREMRIRVPDDIALVSFDDIDLFKLVDPAVTAIAQPVEAIGETAVKILLEQIENETIPIRQEHLAVALVQRASCPGSDVRHAGHKETDPDEVYSNQKQHAINI